MKTSRYSLMPSFVLNFPSLTCFAISSLSEEKTVVYRQSNSWIRKLPMNAKVHTHQTFLFHCLLFLDFCSLYLIVLIRSQVIACLPFFLSCLACISSRFVLPLRMSCTMSGLRFVLWCPDQRCIILTPAR